MAMVGVCDPVAQVTEKQVADHLQRFPGDGKLTGRGLRSLVHYQLTHSQFRSRVVHVTPVGGAVATQSNDETITRGVTQEEIDTHLAWYPDDHWLNRSQLELIVSRAKEENRQRLVNESVLQAQVKMNRRLKRQQTREVNHRLEAVFRSRGMGA